MDKTEVLDAIGNPNSANFKNGQHEWIYIYFKGEDKFAKKLWFNKEVLVRIDDYDPKTLTSKSDANIENVSLDDKEVEEIKKAHTEKQRQKKHEEGFQDLD